MKFKNDKQRMAVMASLRRQGRQLSDKIIITKPSGKLTKLTASELRNVQQTQHKITMDKKNKAVKILQDHKKKIHSKYHKGWDKLIKDLKQKKTGKEMIKWVKKHRSLLEGLGLFGLAEFFAVSGNIPATIGFSISAGELTSDDPYLDKFYKKRNKNIKK